MQSFAGLLFTLIFVANLHSAPLEFTRKIENIASAAKGKVGVMAVVVNSKESVALNSTNHFPMQSVYKLPIAMAVLNQVDGGKIRLGQKINVEKRHFVSAAQHSPIRDRFPDGTQASVEELLRFAVSESDGTASDVLLELVGGPEVVKKYLAGIGVTGLVVENTEKEMGADWQTQYRNWASPQAAVALLRSLHDGSSGIAEQNRALLLSLMIKTPTGAMRLKGLLPKGTIVAHKTGTSGTQRGVTAATNDIGIVILPSGKHLIIAIFVSDSTADQQTREQVIARIAKACWDELKDF